MQKKKEQETKKKKRIKLRFHTKILIIILITIIYSFTLGTKGIQVKEYIIKTKKLSDSYHGLKIVHFSDLHYGSSVNKKDLNKIVTKINNQKPDIVLFTGDLIKKDYELDNNEKKYIKKELSKIKADIGCYYVTGEEDNEYTENILNLSNFINLESKEQHLYKDNTKSILLISNTSKKYFNNEENKDDYKILVIHNPDEYDNYKKFNFDIVLSGHTHNGQINIYKLKELFINSKYKKEYQKIDNTKIFVNSGIGTKIIKARLFNKPTINLYRIYTK